MKLSLLLCLLLTSVLPAEQLRINPKGFLMEEWELRNLCKPTLEIFPKAKDPPLFISHHQDGPITLFQRTPKGEVAIQLNCKDRYYAQFIYQFAHELGHVRANFKPVDHENKWLEEALCETASLFALRQLSIHWKENAPNKALKNYRKSLASYADTVMKAREPLTLETAPAFYQEHRTTLREHATRRNLNGAFANLILPLLEAEPDHWHTLAHIPRKKGATLAEHFDAWRKGTPQKHHRFLAKMEALFLGKPD